MDPKARQQALERARALEKQGQADAAVKAFRDAGALEDAARVLGGSKRPREAGQLLLESLGVQPAQAGQLDAPGKKRALKAAIFLGKAGENALAVQLFLALGEQARAVDLLQRAGDAVGAAKVAALRPGQFDSGPLLSAPRAQAVGGQAVSMISAQKLEEQGKLALALESYVQLRRFSDAARLATRLDRPADAAQLYVDAGLPFEAADAYLTLGDTGKALDNLTRVPRDDAHYRAAAAQAVRLAFNLGTLDFRLEHFLTPFASGGPRDADEVLVFDLLAQLYLTHGHPENAREALAKVLDRDPSFRGARVRLAALDAELRPSARVARQVLEGGDRLKRKTKLESLPALPDLNDQPAAELGDAPPAEPPTMLRHDPELVRRVTGAGDLSGTQLEEPILDLEEAERGGLPELFAVGATIANRYRLDQKIGQGGMAAVFRAHDLELEEDVALKVFAMQQTSDTLVARFKQELKLSRQLQHPNVIRLYDIGMHEGHRYLSLELLVGQSLKERMVEPVDQRTALGYLIQACHGLQAAHDAGVVHRDVKPDNFFVTSDGVLKVMDFGIAKQHAAPGVTMAGSIAGTPLYMSPEQIGNFSTVTHLTDLYALGVCAYELFTGTTPFAHEQLVPLLMMHVNQNPQAPRLRNPSISPELDAVILKLLAKDPQARFQSCRELAQALTAIRDQPLPGAPR